MLLFADMDINFSAELPINEHLPQISALLAQHQVILVAGETGSGKSTQLPKLCLQMGLAQHGLIGHTQPRRIAARSIAARVAEELNSSLGSLVGYQVRFNEALSEHTRIKVMTDGILLAELQHDPLLKKYETLIIDEAHERSLNLDFLFGILKKILPRRPDLKLIITSATLDHERIATFFNAPVIEVSGRSYPISIRYQALDEKRDDPEADGVIAAVKELIAARSSGDILVFLPTERDIRELKDDLSLRFPRCEVLALYARLSMVEQQRVFSRGSMQRIILSTNVAETSLTIPNISFVIDSGLARISRYNARMKVQRLPIEAISQANAKQRAGRAGRTQVGVCIRLYSEDDFNLRPSFTTPEILRTNLASVILQMLKLNLGAIENFPFLDMPEHRLIQEGYRELLELQFIELKNEAYVLTPLGKRAAQLPLDPRLASMILAASKLHVLSEVLIIVSLLSLQDPRETPAESRDAALNKHRRYANPQSEFLSILNLWWYFNSDTHDLSQNKIRAYCKTYFLSYIRVREWLSLIHEIKDICVKQNMGFKTLELGDELPKWNYDMIHQALLHGSLSFIGTYDLDAQCYVGSFNKRFQIFPGSSLSKAKFKWLMAESLMETQKIYARMIAQINPTWLEPIAVHLVKRTYHQAHFDVKSGAVKAFETVLLYGLTIIHGRKVHYARIDPLDARIVFIREGLIQGQLLMPPAFLQENLHQQKQLEMMQAKLRRLDLRVDEEKLFEFYQKCLPENIVGAQELSAWVKHAKPSELQACCFDLLNFIEGLELDALQAYPDVLNLQGKTYALTYIFEPMEDRDGIVLQIPLHELMQMPDTLTYWQVPGFLREKVSYILKDLPKHLRKLLMPIEACIAAFMAQLRRDYWDQYFYEDLSEFLLQYIKIQHGAVHDDLTALSADELAGIEIPEFLQFKFEVVNAEHKVLAKSRSIKALKQHFAQQIQTHVKKEEHPWPKEIVKTWQFGDLPETFMIRVQGKASTVYPVVRVHKDGVMLELLADAGEVAQTHAEGVFALLHLALASELRSVLRDSAIQNALAQFNFLQNKASLTDDLIRLILKMALKDYFQLDGMEIIVELEDYETKAVHFIEAPLMQCLANIRSEAEFKKLLGVKTQIFALQENFKKWFVNLSMEVVEARSSLRRLAAKKGLQDSFVDLEAEFDTLLQMHFSVMVPLAWLLRYPLYFKGMNIRLTRLQNNPQKELKLLPEVVHIKRLLQAYDDVELPFYLEELRLNVFADLRPAVKISLDGFKKSLS